MITYKHKYILWQLIVYKCNGNYIIYYLGQFSKNILGQLSRYIQPAQNL